jgi:hypothetical protein
MYIEEQKGASLIMTFFTACYIFFIGRVRAANNMRKSKILRSENGASLIMTFFIMVIILAVVLSISLLLYGEIKVTRNIGSSMESLYVAESGIEKIFYYDRQVLPTVEGEGKTAARGLCSMYSQDANNLNACIPDQSPNTTGVDHSIYCNNTVLPQVATEVSDPLHNPNGCSPDTCNDCKISFSTTLNSASNKAYYATAQITPLADGSFSFQVESKGNFGSVARQVEVVSNETPHVQPTAIVITNACADPKSTPQGSAIDISADVTLNVPGTDQISKVTAIIRDMSGVVVDTKPLVLVSGLKNGLGTWKYTWPTTGSTPAQAYSVDLEARDTLNKPSITLLTNIPPCGL